MYSFQIEKSICNSYKRTGASHQIVGFRNCRAVYVCQVTKLLHIDTCLIFSTNIVSGFINSHSAQLSQIGLKKNKINIWVTRKNKMNIWLTRKNKMNIWLTRKNKTNIWLTRKNKKNIWLTRKNKMNTWVTRKNKMNILLTRKNKMKIQLTRKNKMSIWSS